jgi:hypothetical protein
MMMKTKQWMQFAVMMLICVITAMSAKAQNSPLRMGVGVDVGSTLKKPARTTLGFDLRLQKSIGNGVSGILTTGYYQFFKANKYNEGFGIIPLKVGLKYFPVKNIYVAGEIGAGFGTKSGTGTSFVYSPSFGLAFGDGFDVSLKYENFTDYNGYAQQLALRFAYGFKL